MAAGSARRSYGFEHSAVVQCAIDLVQCERHFAEPSDVRANPTAAFTTGEARLAGRRDSCHEKEGGCNCRNALEKLSVHADDVSRSRLLVKVVHVLGADEKSFLQSVSSLARASSAGFGLTLCEPQVGVSLRGLR